MLLHSQVASQLHSLLRSFAPDGQVEKTSYDDFYIDVTAACCSNSSCSNGSGCSSNMSGSGSMASTQRLQLPKSAAAFVELGPGMDTSRVFVVTMPAATAIQQQSQQPHALSSSTLQQQQQQQQQVLPANWHLLDPELQRGVVLALQLRAAVKASLGLTVSCGVAPGKLLARLVTPLHKPDAVTGACDA
jgi:nucleotidyltransferase/DNA polymerase involved in DNA repair